MSGSPPSEHPVEPPQLAGHRRKRSDTPQEAPFATPVSEPSSGPGTAEIHSIQQQTAPVSTTARPLVPPYSSSYPSTQRYDYGTAGPPPMGTSATAAESQPRQGEVSPRITRKTKAHVASACMNCKKKHLRCDNARPCRRCVQSGKETTCVDVEHKKRGRPPLKAEESQTRRPFGSALSPLQGSQAGFGRLSATELLGGYAPQQHTRDLRPVPSGSAGDMGRPVYPRAPHSYQTMYAQPTVSPSHATATGTMSRPLYTDLPRASQSQYGYPMTPSAGAGAMAPDPAGRYAGNYPYNPTAESASGQSSQHFSLFPRTTAQQQQAMVQSSSRASYGQMQGMPSDLRLPPIQPAPPGGSIDPAMAQQQRHAHQQQQQPPREDDTSNGGGSTRQPDPKRPKISDILRDD